MGDTCVEQALQLRVGPHRHRVDERWTQRPERRQRLLAGERWTLVILRNLLLGCTTFTEIADGAPGISRTLLTTRLRQLERAGVVTRVVGPGGRTVRYELTGAGTDLWEVVVPIGNWGEGGWSWLPSSWTRSWCSGRGAATTSTTAASRTSEW